MKQIKLRGYGKVNLTLDILGKRDDGYHEIETIMQSVGIYDTVTIEKTNDGKITLTTSLSFLPSGESNTAYIAAKLFIEKYNIPQDVGVKIHIDKNIPVAAGMAGGSVDAATVLVGLNKLFEVDADIEEIKELSSKIGSDIPFTVEGGTQLSTGRGEVCEKLKDLAPCYFLIVKPKFSVSTKDVYHNLNVKKIYGHPDTKGVIAAIESGDINYMSKRMYNVLQEVTEKMHSQICEIVNKVLSCGALGAIMSGSGPTVFGVFDTNEDAEKIVQEFKKDNMNAFFVTNKNCGIEIVECN